MATAKEKKAAAAAALQAKALELSGLDQAGYDALTDDERKTFTDAAAVTEDVKLEPVILSAPYAFYDDDEKLHSWAAGETVKDAESIQILIDRRAPIVAVEE